MARAAGSTVARTLTGLPGIVASMVTEAGDRASGETPERTAARQAQFQKEYDAIVKRSTAPVEPSAATAAVEQLQQQMKELIGRIDIWRGK